MRSFTLIINLQYVTSSYRTGGPHLHHFPGVLNFITRSIAKFTQHCQLLSYRTLCQSQLRCTERSINNTFCHLLLHVPLQQLQYTFIAFSDINYRSKFTSVFHEHRSFHRFQTDWIWHIYCTSIVQFEENQFVLLLSLLLLVRLCLLRKLHQPAPMMTLRQTKTLINTLVPVVNLTHYWLMFPRCVRCDT